MAYINAFVAHLRAVSEWGARSGAAINLDMINFEMEVKCRNRYCTFHPQFVTTVQGRLANTREMTPETGGFAGWLPYRALTFELSQDKLRFKQLMDASGMRTPAKWNVADPSVRPDKDYILKRSMGSFGYELSGPYPSHSFAAEQKPPAGEQRGTLFAEQFVRGRAVKLWCWGALPFFAHVQQFATVKGDGESSLQQLLEQRFDKVGTPFAAYREQHVTRDCLAFQGLSLTDVPPAGSAPFIDYRYGREHQGRASLESDNQLPAMSERVKRDMTRAANLMAGELLSRFPAPVLYSMDAVLDDNEDLWWLEVNSNPTLPPEGYAPMFSDLFGA